MGRSYCIFRLCATTGIAAVAAFVAGLTGAKAAAPVPDRTDEGDYRAASRVASLSPSDAAVRQRLKALRDRASALDLEIAGDPASPQESGKKRSVIAQWYNWPNWPNYWNDWRNWPNGRWLNY